MSKKIFITLLLLFGLSFSLSALQFDHDKHLKTLEGEECSVCHKVDTDKSVKPSNNTCLDCHDKGFVESVKFPGLKTHYGVNWAIKHKVEAKMDKYDCNACHKQSFCMDCHKGGFADEIPGISDSPVNVHRSDFIVAHPLYAKSDPNSCQSCHEVKFCSDCHEKFSDEDLQIESHRKGWSNLQTSPSGPAHSQFNEYQCQTCHTNSVLPSHEWSNNHAREARKNLATCQSCHSDGDTCLKCHSARTGLMVNPHPKDWDDIKDNIRKATNGKTCRKCH
ncbi:hypothetical protein OWM07_05505 [Deferribacter thermophilus]|uniref:cytochrome c3 family protein n=1 Tax=Deferribacter thermophilus TaxID=53573 RepID=UPI003C226C52